MATVAPLLSLAAMQAACHAVKVRGSDQEGDVATERLPDQADAPKLELVKPSDDVFDQCSGSNRRRKADAGKGPSDPGPESFSSEKDAEKDLPGVPDEAEDRPAADG